MFLRVVTFNRLTTHSYARKISAVFKVVSVVLTFERFAGHTHHRRNFNDIQSHAFVFKKLRICNGGLICADNLLRCCEEIKDCTHWRWCQYKPKRVGAETRVWLCVHSVVHKCWLINSDNLFYEKLRCLSDSCNVFLKRCDLFMEESWTFCIRHSPKLTDFRQSNDKNGAEDQLYLIDPEQ